MRSSWIKSGLVLALASLLVVSLAACGQDVEIEQQLIEVTRGDLALTISADGNLSLPQYRKLTFGVSGTVTKVYVEESDKVTEGEVLAKLDSTSMELAVKTAGINLEIATDNFRKITYPYDYRTWALDVPTAMAHVGDAQRELNDALLIMQELGLSREQYEWEQYWDVWHSLKRAQENLVVARDNLIRGYGQDVFGSGMLPMRDFWTLREAQLEMDKALLDLDRAKDDLEKAVIVAPFDGIVATVGIKEGENLSSFDYATKIIFEIVDPVRMELEAEVDELDVPAVRRGQRAIISVDALPDVQFEGKVNYVSPLSFEESGLILYKAKIGFDVPEYSGLKSGMSATADIIVDERNDILLVLSRAIETDSSGNSMVEVKVGEQIEERPVVIGISDGLQTEIVDGLDEGEIVVLERRVKAESGGGIFGQ